jgi:hypothetical protein
MGLPCDLAARGLTNNRVEMKIWLTIAQEICRPPSLKPAAGLSLAHTTGAAAVEINN